jgi:hypothetical protein
LWLFDQVEDLPGRVAFEAPDDFASGLALLDAALVVVLRARVDPQAGEDDAVERGIGLTVTTTVRRRNCRRPEERSTGLTPHKAAKDASLSSRSGLSPTVISRATAVSGPIPTTSSSCGA